MKYDPQKQIKEAGLKVTDARVSILGAFSAGCHPLSAEEIWKKVKKHSIDLVTVYRTLKSFEEKELLRKVDLHKETLYYELNLHHHHLVCKKCGVVEEFKLCDVDKMIGKIVREHRTFKTISAHSLELFGVCRVCATN